MPTVIVKWQKEVFPAVEVDTSQPAYVFKCQLYDLTGVPPERQKIMVKGGLLKDDADWSTVGVKEGQRLMMMGTADEIVKAPEKGPVFMEDLPEEEQVVAVGHSSGLYNLGNTCYMNSTIQCLHSVPELKSALLRYSQSSRSNDLDQTSHLLTVATRDLFTELDKNVKPVAPMQFWMVLRKKHPQFGQLHNGAFMQQDAEECLTLLLYTLSQSLRSDNSSDNLNTVKALFGIELTSRVHCQESGEESSEIESTFALKCHISQEVNHLHEGLKHGLKSELEKTSPALGRSAIYLKESRISGLPRYLTIQFVRFFWKRESNQKAKILRKVDYPLVLDVYDFCSDDLQKKLEVPRQILRDEESKKLGSKGSEKSSDSKDNDVKMLDAEDSSNKSGEPSGTTSPEGASSKREMHLTGIYDLVAVLTHKGRSADSGHYVAWVKQESGKEQDGLDLFQMANLMSLEAIKICTLLQYAARIDFGLEKYLRSAEKFPFSSTIPCPWFASKISLGSSAASGNGSAMRIVSMGSHCSSRRGNEWSFDKCKRQWDPGKYCVALDLDALEFYLVFNLEDKVV